MDDAHAPCVTPPSLSLFAQSSTERALVPARRSCRSWCREPITAVRHDWPMSMERGMVGRLPSLAQGNGTPLLFVGGLTVKTGVDAAGTEQMMRSLLKPFAKRRRVVFVNRRPGLPRGMSMADLAEEHADAISSWASGRSTSPGSRPAAASFSSWPPTIPTSSVAWCSSAPPAGSGPSGRTLQRRVAARIRRGAHPQALALIGERDRSALERATRGRNFRAARRSARAL